MRRSYILGDGLFPNTEESPALRFRSATRILGHKRKRKRMNKTIVIAGAALVGMIGCQTALKSANNAVADWKDNRCEVKVLKSSVEDKDIAKSIETLAVVPYGLYQSTVVLVDKLAPDEKVRPEFAAAKKYLTEEINAGNTVDVAMKNVAGKIKAEFGPEALARIKKYSEELKSRKANGSLDKLLSEQTSLQERVNAAVKDVSERTTAILATVQKIKGNPLYVAGQVSKAKDDLAFISAQLTDSGKGLALAGTIITLEISDASAKVTVKAGEGMVKGGKIMINGVEYTCEAAGDAVAIPLTDLMIAMADTGDGVKED